MRGKAILWDFDGTLAWRDGLWGSALMQALDEQEPGHGVIRDNIRPYLRDGFPWHRPERPHPELCSPEAWWAETEGLIARAFRAVGFETHARELAKAAHAAFIDPAGYQLFDDAIPALERLANAGWRHVVLSNHVPELEDIVVSLGLRRHFDAVISSALTGYEKPHPEAFRLALEMAGSPERLWMVGDNPVADIEGAERAGIPAILVHSDSPARRRARDLLEAAAIIAGAGERMG
jgi:putative hydrolase of the HAD superfamily